MTQQDDILVGVISTSGQRGPQGPQGPQGEPGSQVSVSATGTSTNEVSYITIDGVESKLAGGGTGEPSSYLKSASTSGNTLTLTNKDDTTVTYTPTVPTKTSDLVNDSGFLTEHQSLADYRTSAAQDIIDATKQDKLTAGTNVQINNNVISATDTTYSEATTSTAGLMSSTDKTKLNGISTGATATSVSSTGTSTDEVSYITIDGVEKKIAGGATPSNMVTTDTEQTITGKKIFNTSFKLGTTNTYLQNSTNDDLVAAYGNKSWFGNISKPTVIKSSTRPQAFVSSSFKDIMLSGDIAANPATTTATLTGITIGGTSYSIAAEPTTYIKSASVNNRTLTLTNKDDTTVTFTDTGSIVSGTNDGTNWQTITIDGTTKSIPSGGGSLPAYPTEDGTYLLSATVSSGTTTLAWADTEWTDPVLDNSILTVAQLYGANNVSGSLEVE